MRLGVPNLRDAGAGAIGAKGPSMVTARKKPCKSIASCTYSSQYPRQTESNFNVKYKKQDLYKIKPYLRALQP
jgi:hypothetical protein